MTFRNGSSVAHNLTFTGGLSVATRTIVEPGAVEVLHLVPPAAGAYPFVCTIHSGDGRPARGVRRQSLDPPERRLLEGY